MLHSIAGKTIFDSRRAMIGWMIGTALAALLVVAIYPIIRDTPEILDLLESYPEAMLEMFGIDDIDSYTSPPGFLETQLFSTYVPLIFLIFAIGRGVSVLAGEERDRTLDVLLANPVSRERVILEKAAAIAALIAVLGAVVFVVVLSGSLLYEGWPSVVNLVSAVISAILMGLTYGWLALAAGAVTGRRGMAMGVAAGLAVATYIINGVAPLVEGLEWAVNLSPFNYYLDHNPLQNGFHLGNAAVLAGLCALFLGVAVWGFRRRDVGVARS
ncbi:MAG: ABC transporter permease [Acidimicrobiia bacterium]|nr:ABC transporter permease [Acidimicrobiia bacterium]